MFYLSPYLCSFLLTCAHLTTPVAAQLMDCMHNLLAALARGRVALLLFFLVFMVGSGVGTSML